MDHDVSVGRAVVVNGESVRVQSATLADLLVEFGYAESRVATALNGDFVPAAARSSTQMSDGDRVEIIAPRQGG